MDGMPTHQLDKVMKHVTRDRALRDAPDNLKEINSKLLSVKAIVAFMKQLRRNYSLLEEFALMQESETRFITPFDVTERFIRSAQLLPHLNQDMKSTLSSLFVETRQSLP